jgi:uncharacterized membrane protein YqgA involved in biofilm formation
MISLNIMMVMFRSIQEIKMFGLHPLSVLAGAVVGACVPVVGNWIREQVASVKTKAAPIEAKVANAVTTAVDAVEKKL